MTTGRWNLQTGYGVELRHGIKTEDDMRKQDLPGRVLGFVTIGAAALMFEGGVLEVLVYWGRETAPVAVGALGACASALLLVAGLALATRRPYARRTAIAGAAGMIPVHLVGWILGIVGYGGALPGVVYPALLLWLLKTRPHLGAPASASERMERSDSPSTPDRRHDREATVLA